MSDTPDSVQVGGADDTEPGANCLLCSARARVDAALVRIGATMVTVVSNYKRARIGPHATEESKAIVTVGDGNYVGQGHSREEAIVSSLECFGVEL